MRWRGSRRDDDGEWPSLQTGGGMLDSRRRPLADNGSAWPIMVLLLTEMLALLLCYGAHLQG